MLNSFSQLFKSIVQVGLGVGYLGIFIFSLPAVTLVGTANSRGEIGERWGVLSRLVLRKELSHIRTSNLLVSPVREGKNNLPPF